MKSFRINDWKDTHLLFVTLCSFIWLFYYEETNFIKHLLFLVLSSISMASLGYYINDIFDIQKDDLVGKFNFASKHSKTKQVFICIILIAIAILSWYVMESNNTDILILLILELFLFFIYSFPLLRWKEYPFFSVVIDASYAYVIGGSITLLLLMPLKAKFIFIHYIYFVWLFVIGLRGIISHHIKDYQNDIRSNTRTTATKYGVDKVSLIQKFILPPIELGLFCVFLFMLYKPTLIYYSIYLFFHLTNSKRYLLFASKTIRHHLLEISNILLDNFYYIWLPPFFLTMLIIKDIWYSFIGILYVILFYKRIQEFTINIYYIILQPIYNCFFSIGSFIVNHALYYAFLIFGINLKEKNKHKNN